MEAIRRALAAALLVALVLGLGGCARATSAAKYLDDAVRGVLTAADDPLRTSLDDLLRNATRESDVLATQLATIERRLADLRLRYEAIPPEARAAGCDFAGSMPSKVIADDEVTWDSASEDGLRAVMGLNHSASAKMLSDDFADAFTELEGGKPSVLGVLLIQTAVCQLK